MSDDVNEKTLSQMIEKIIVKGSVSFEDQSQLNRKALSEGIGGEASEAMARLIKLIEEGQVTVLQ